MECGLLVERQGGDPMIAPQARDVDVGGLWQRQTAERVLDGDLPGGNRAEVDLVARSLERLARPHRQLARAGDDPQKRARIEKDPHRPPPSNSLTTFSGSG